MECLLGFTNGAKACNIWRDRGFPLLDASINRQEGGELRVCLPLFREETSMQYDTPLFTLSGVGIGDGSQAVDAMIAPSYRQFIAAPDSAQPDELLARREVTWHPYRSGVRQLFPERLARATITLCAPPARCPSLSPLKTGMTPTAGWCGEITLPRDQAGRRGKKLAPISPAQTVRAPAFRFEEVEILGFRIDLTPFMPKVERLMEDLVDPLNFHVREEPGRVSGAWMMPPDFRYRASTRTLVIELLRYGRMKSRRPPPPLTTDDTQSQHELMVRMLVGRVDDDTAQAHGPAVYVPAIFVDNPWSKMLGRNLLGFDKRMADFRVQRDGELIRLRPDGHRSADPQANGSTAEERPAPEPLGDIAHVNLVGRTGGQRGPALLSLEIASDGHTNRDSLEPIDVDMVLGPTPLVGTRWRRSDFDAAEFSSAFGSLAVEQSVRAFRSIQVAPIAHRDLDRSWVTGTFRVDGDVRAQLPVGIATLTLHAAPAGLGDTSAPAAWNRLCDALGDGRSATISVTTGNWYRLLCSMDLTIDDGLDRSQPDS